MKTRDLLLYNGADDKHFLLGKKISLCETKHLIDVFFTSDDPVISLADIPTFQKKYTHEKKQKNINNKKEILQRQNQWLLSMGSIVLFGNDIPSSEIALLERDPLSPSDPLRLTMPAGRMDNSLSKGIAAELFEEIIFGSEQYYYEIDFLQKEYSPIQKKYREKLCLPPKPVQVLSPSPLSLPNLFTVRIFLDEKCIDNISDIFFVIDEENFTLEFRRIFLIPRPNDLSLIYDGDGFQRNIFLIPLQKLQKAIQSSNNSIQNALLYSGKNLLQEVEFFPSAKQGKKHSEKIDLPFPICTKTLTEFILFVSCLQK
jgi:hypothetical protein